VAAQLLAGKGFSQIYNLSGGIMAWQSEVAVGDQTEGLALFSGDESVEAALKVAYGLEAGLRDFYLSMAAKEFDASVQKLFSDLAEIEVKHQERLLSTYSEMTGQAAIKADFEAAVDGHLEGGLSTEAFLARFTSDIDRVVDVISMAMAIEAQALDLYQRAGDNSASAESRKAFERIANEEKAHLKSLGELMETQV
jgi:sulfur-carrier protein adenylyltransferase/sulfurtransferase